LFSLSERQLDCTSRPRTCQYGLPPADQVIAHNQHVLERAGAGPGRNASVVDTAGVDLHANKHDISS